MIPLGRPMRLVLCERVPWWKPWRRFRKVPGRYVLVGVSRDYHGTRLELVDELHALRDVRL